MTYEERIIYFNWTKATLGVGCYILTDVNVKYVHASKMCSYGNSPLIQIVLTYDKVYSPLQLLERL